MVQRSNGRFCAPIFSAYCAQALCIPDEMSGVLDIVSESLHKVMAT
jgi:hypothetical protein